ncbi:MAG: hypothetical protein S4CHLAM7_01970 [Chlamydiae bacterium]|nr:hypothetical protein [Chlamydiota bacterium]
MRQLFETQRVIIEQFEKRPFYQRDQFNEIIDNKNITGIVGSRGVGKTTFLLWYAIKCGAKERQALYVSADNIFFLENKLLDVVAHLYNQTQVKIVLIDEIHKYPNWRAELKNISDTYPSIQVYFSGSSMIDLVQGKYDLSRRVTLHSLTGFSFREYLEFIDEGKIRIMNFDDILLRHSQLTSDYQIPKILMHFKEYLKCGYYPFFEGYKKDYEKFQSLENAIQMTIYEDIGTLHSLKTSSLRVIEQLYKFIISSSPGEMSAFKLAKTLGKDFDTISSYLRYLQEAGLVRFIYPGKTGKAQLKNPIKIYPDNTNLIHAAIVPLLDDQERGKIRETFVVNQIQSVKIPLFYSEYGDFKVKDFIIEVGGRGKTTKQIQKSKDAYIIADDIVEGSERIIPMYLLGFLY